MVGIIHIQVGIIHIQVDIIRNIITIIIHHMDMVGIMDMAHMVEAMVVGTMDTAVDMAVGDMAEAGVIIN